MFKKQVVISIAVIIILSLTAVAYWAPGGHHPVSKAQGKVAVIYVDGVIMGGRSQSGLLGDSSGTDSIIRQIRDAREDSSIKAVVLRINSPGGSAPASQEMASEIKKLRASGKPVVASMGDVAASGGYWIAAVTEKIYANPATLTGSIGVYIPYSNWEELYKKLGIREEKIKSGPHKDILSPNREMTVEERAIIQAMVDELYNQFVAVVAEGRHMDPAKVRQLADGRIYTGSQAKKLGLVDELGTLYDAIDGAAKMAGIQGTPEITEYGKASPWQMLFGSESQFSLNDILNHQLKNELPITAPMAMPVNFSGE